MKIALTYILILLPILLFSQSVDVIDNKGTIKSIESSKWTLIGNDIFNKNTGNVEIDAGTLFIDALNNRVGIGTKIPTEILSLSGENNRVINVVRPIFANRPGADLTILAGGASTGANNRTGGDLFLSSGISTGSRSSNIFFQTAEGLGFGTTDRIPATKMTILGNGNVGIGLTNPTSQLHVQENLHVVGNILDSDGDVGVMGDVLSSTVTGTNWISITSAVSSDWSRLGNDSTDPSINFLGTTDAQDLVFRANNSEVMRVFSYLTNPNVGIGRTSLIGVNGGASSYSGSTLFFGDASNISSSTGLDFIIDDDNNATNASFAFKANGDGAAGTIELMQINETGNIGIGLPSGTASSILHTYGTLRFENLGTNTVNTNILTTDTNGNVTTRDLSTLFSGSGITSLNGLTSSSQTFATGTSGTDFNIASSTSTHTFNFPDASASSRGLLTLADWTTFNTKIGIVTATTPAAVTTVGTTATINNTTAYWNANQLQSNNIATTAPTTDGQVLTWNATNSNWEPRTATTSSSSYLTQLSDIVNTTNGGFVSINNFTTTLTAGKRYNCNCKIIFTSTGSNNGSGISLVAPSGVAALRVNIPESNTGIVIGNFAVNGDTITTANFPSTSGNHLIEINGILIPTADGTFGINFRNERQTASDAITVRAGSFCKLEEY